MNLLKILDDLELTQTELAKLLSVNVRTVWRWVKNPNDIPGPAKQTLQAWLKLHQVGLVWRPDEIDLFNNIDETSKEIKKILKELTKLEKSILEWRKYEPRKNMSKVLFAECLLRERKN